MPISPDIAFTSAAHLDLDLDNSCNADVRFADSWEFTMPDQGQIANGGENLVVPFRSFSVVRNGRRIPISRWSIYISRGGLINDSPPGDPLAGAQNLLHRLSYAAWISGYEDECNGTNAQWIRQTDPGIDLGCSGFLCQVRGPLGTTLFVAMSTDTGDLRVKTSLRVQASKWGGGETPPTIDVGAFNTPGP